MTGHCQLGSLAKSFIWTMLLRLMMNIDGHHFVDNLSLKGFISFSNCFRLMTRIDISSFLVIKITFLSFSSIVTNFDFSCIIEKNTIKNNTSCSRTCNYSKLEASNMLSGSWQINTFNIKHLFIFKQLHNMVLCTQ